MPGTNRTGERVDRIDLTITELIGMPMEDWAEWIEQQSLSAPDRAEIALRLYGLAAAA